MTMATDRIRAVRLRPRSAAAIALASLVGLIAFFWPLLATGTSALAGHSADAPYLFVIVLPLLMAIVLAEVSEGGMDAKAVALLGVLAAIGAALRPLGAGTAGFEPVFFLLVLAGRVLGRGFGFVLGAVTLFASALLTAGVGPWLPFQMFGAAWVGFFAGCLPAARGRWEIALLSAYGAVAGLVYGLLLNLSFWPFLTGAGSVSSTLTFVPGDPLGANLARFVAFDLATSLGFDIPRALVTAALVAVTGPVVLGALRRAARRAAFEAPITFTPAESATAAPSAGPRR
jgi:energy-coupling factor transport system substrate-specific component